MSKIESDALAKLLAADASINTRSAKKQYNLLFADRDAIRSSLKILEGTDVVALLIKAMLGSAPTPDDSSKPTQPGNFRVTGVTSNSITMEWDASVDVGPAGLAGYEVYKVQEDGASVSPPVKVSGVSLIPAGTNTFTHSGLPALKWIRYAVLAVDNKPSNPNKSDLSDADGDQTLASGGGPVVWIEQNVTTLPYNDGLSYFPKINGPGMETPGGSGRHLGANPQTTLFICNSCDLTAAPVVINNGGRRFTGNWRGLKDLVSNTNNAIIPDGSSLYVLWIAEGYCEFSPPNEIDFRHRHVTINVSCAPNTGVEFKGVQLALTGTDVVIIGGTWGIGIDSPTSDPYPSASVRDSLLIAHPFGATATRRVMAFATIKDGGDELVDGNEDEGDFTLLSCAFVDALENTGHPDGAHPFGVLAGRFVKRFAMLRCFGAGIPYRFPLFRGEFLTAAENALYCPQFSSGVMGQPIEIGWDGVVHKGNIVNNLFIARPGVSSLKKLMKLYPGPAGGSAICVKGNDVHGFSGQSFADQTSLVDNAGGYYTSTVQTSALSIGHGGSALSGFTALDGTLAARQAMMTRIRASAGDRAKVGSANARAQKWMEDAQDVINGSAPRNSLITTSTPTYISRGSTVIDLNSTGSVNAHLGGINIPTLDEGRDNRAPNYTGLEIWEALQLKRTNGAATP